MTKTLKKQLKFWFFTLLTLAVSIADISLTYIGTPDLSNESNPLVVTAGLGWFALIASNALIFLIMVVLYRQAFLKFDPVTIKCNGFKEYMSMLLFGRPDKFNWIWYKIPSNKVGQTYLFSGAGYMVAVLTILRIRYVIEWIGVLTDSRWVYEYFEWLQHIGFTTAFGRFDVIIVSLMGAIGTLILWYYIQYRLNKKALMIDKEEE